MSAPAHLEMSPADRAWTYGLLAAGGAAILGLGPLLATWLADVPIVPFRDALRWVGGFDAWWLWVLRIVGGAVAGAVVAAVVIADQWRLEVYDDHVLVLHGSDRRRIERARIEGVHLERKKIVIEGVGGQLLAAETEAPRAAVISAFRERDYPMESS